MTVEQKSAEQNDRFPVGMRVLAVDDDPTCLMLLDTLLRKCQYHVTTTSQAVMALKMLRENRNMFDLVISDVHMPDMDGFKLLELVGLEMDLPVITLLSIVDCPLALVLSAYGDTKLVMKGIGHGACDYLLKPVRIEELKNIWQHVIRRKKFDPKDQKDFEKPHHRSAEVGGVTGTGDLDQNGKISRKRKDQIDEEDEEREEDEQINEDPSAQKKPRVVWSVELHRKFVAAVSQLGLDKAVPKKILDMMNVEKLTRENVASHLQAQKFIFLTSKYRLYLKRISCVASQQANMVAALGSADSAYLQMASLNGLGNIHDMADSGQLHDASFTSFSPTHVLGRLNTPTGLGMRSLSSSATVRLGHTHNSCSPDGLNSFHPVIQPGNQNGRILQGVPMSLELDQLQQNHHVGGLSATNHSMAYPVCGGFSDTKGIVGSSRNSHYGVPTNPVKIEGHLQDTHLRVASANQPFVPANCYSTEFPSDAPDFERCNGNWSSVPQSSEVQANCYTLSDCFRQTNLIDSSDGISSIAMHMATSRQDVSSMPALLPDTRTDSLQSQTALTCSNAAQNVNLTLKQAWDNHRQDAAHQLNPFGFSAPFNKRLDPESTTCHLNSGFSLNGQSNFVDPFHMLHNDVDQSTMEKTPKLKSGHLKEGNKPQGNYAHKTVDSLEDLVSVMMNQVCAIVPSFFTVYMPLGFYRSLRSHAMKPPVGTECLILET
ncbi:hypothetical protein RJ640_025787 [Escallonia rubra]|uniref:Response regulatory domain-containing protein n=1 Tax=Escallonia rubra TaxID=112253 RepID=A0AA88UVL5_9ASTE|nr:hypothetical protein RJ640_025787 [Escallonia rubra]